ncbi:MAG: hypothetical protein GY712_10130 [Oceanicoccus sp.]|uniref:COG3014 family protein n=1 Tax=Oceanicoccus sp. TaxID=2691044 RepID=UPI002606B100|nr:hypothetical protein [Oceanicoccus sp.]MCP3908358.1 hypothetical protein [Oceanicoccus sp.]MDG1773026.1 hypothetical protein [Oceanicoccus sp.]
MVAVLRSVKVTLLLVLALLSGCVAQHKVNSLAESLQVAGADSTLAALEKINPNNRDRAQYLLNRGTLYRLNGNIDASTEDLEAAKSIMHSLQASSLSENFAALTINETLRSYAGTASERVLVHTVLAYNYLQQSDLASARVEMLQADITMREVADGDTLRGQLASSHFLAGLIYELNGEWDNAMISYRSSADILDQRGQPIPDAVQKSLLQTSLRQGLKEEYQRYSQRFAKTAQPLAQGEKELIVFYFDGTVSHKRQQTLSIYSFELKQQISLSVPYYAPHNSSANYYPRPLTLSVAGQSLRTGLIEDLEILARNDFNDEIPAITAAATARVVAKYQLVEKMRRERGDSMAALLNLASTIAEQADLRSWNMLPSSIQVARIRIAADIDVEAMDLTNGLNASELLKFNQGNTLLLLANSVGH